MAPPPGTWKTENQSGVALITVLALMVLMSVLVLAIFSMSQTELASSQEYSDSLRSQQLSDLSINLVMSQIRQSTRQNPTIEGKEAWASQPGAIRTYHEKGDFLAGYKLYSADSMVVSEEKQLSTDRPPPDWNSETNSSHYVDLNRPLSRQGEVFFPIVDPRAIDDKIDGFNIEEGALSGIVRQGDPIDYRLPMPVRWLYVLQDGSLGHLDESSLKFVGNTPATRKNPIVGRIAFWTDDETAKINLNTASEPTPWDTPRAINLDDMEYGKFQPGKNEFQRYPGHPATTALSPVLFPDRNFDLTGKEKEALYGVLPRVVEGGTASGAARAQAILQPDSDRLFATVDEFLFLPNRQEVSTKLPELTRSQLRSARFFLTARSRAVELNPLGQPKVGIWPIWAQGNRRTAYDHLAAFCSTIGDHYYGFQRLDSRSAKNDWEKISRNQEIYYYLVRSLSQPIPGYGESFKKKWEEDLEQVVTESFDYLRCANLREKALPATPEGSPPPTGRNLFAANGQVVPLRIEENQTMGFGRYLTISEFGIHFICNGHGKKGLKPPAGEEPLGEEERLIQASFLVEPFSASQGWPGLVNDFTIEVEGLDAFKIGDESMGFPERRKRRPGNLGASWHGRNWGGPMGIRTFIGNTGGNYPFLSKRVRMEGKTLSFKGGEITVRVFQGNSSDDKDLVQTFHLMFPDGTFPVPDLVEEGTKKYRGGVATGASYWWDFSKRYSATTRVPHAPGAEYANPRRRWPADTGGNPPGFKVGGVFRAEDVVRTIAAWHGDHRLFACLHDVPLSVFRPTSDDYLGSDKKLIHLFNDTQGTHLLYGFANEPGLTSSTAPGVQLTDAEYHYSRLPDVPANAGQYNQFGDFDNGVAQIHDGAYINRPDEGNVATKGQYAYFAWNYAEPREVNFSPNRILPSPGMLGSLPTGVKRELPWQTLLFRPDQNHPGAESPPDHLLMDFFWMPVIEPYAISEPFSTAGKINLNYRIVPFDYIERSTGLHGVFRGEMPLAVPNPMSKIYKLWDHETSDHPWLPNSRRGNLDNEVLRKWDQAAKGLVKMRKPIDVGKTLKQFEERFDKDEIFRYPSEICSVHLVREGESLSEYQDGTFWEEHLVTGDNVRERPYTNLYPRLTTQSNTYRIHYWTESLKKSRYSSPDTSDPLTDTVVGRFRGSSLIERYLDPNDPEFPDFAEENASDKSLDEFIQMRVVETTRFAP
ncbi:MAG: Verru_Chthon cassette protein A [Verrucomicrobiae bacterium]|nr:Verru_Chthon cassette protein A [Verrucomicrobiae bacterium]